MKARLMDFKAGDRVVVTDRCRNFPEWIGRVGTVMANPNLQKAIPTVGVQFDGYKTVEYLHVNFLRHGEAGVPHPTRENK